MGSVKVHVHVYRPPTASAPVRRTARDADYSRMDKGALAEAYNIAIGAGKKAEATAIRAEQERRASSTSATFARRTGRDAPVGHAAWRGKPKVTLAQAKSQLAALGVTLKNNNGDEFVVNLKGAGEATAYYSDDLDDALATGIHMANRARTGGGDRRLRAKDGDFDFEVSNARRFAERARSDAAKAVRPRARAKYQEAAEAFDRARALFKSGAEDAAEMEMNKAVKLSRDAERLDTSIGRDAAGEKRWTGGAMDDATEAALLGETTGDAASINVPSGRIRPGTKIRVREGRGVVTSISGGFIFYTVAGVMHRMDEDDAYDEMEVDSGSSRDRLAYEDELLGEKVWTGDGPKYPTEREVERMTPAQARATLRNLRGNAPDTEAERDVLDLLEMLAKERD